MRSVQNWKKTTSSLLDEQSGENNDSIALLKQQYEINHTKYAKDILKRIQRYKPWEIYLLTVES